MLNLTVHSGRMANEPELQHTPSGVCYIRFRLAVERDYTANGEYPTDFLSFIAWRKTAQFIAKHFHKGAMITIQGRLEENNWTDKEGNKHYGMVVNVDQAWFGETKKAREDRERRAGDQGYEEAYAYTDADVPPEFMGTYEEN